ncbi:MULTISPECIES: ATPase AAA [Erwinia]|uniref:ATPase AAA n=1 Tax=Erwinia TaxID=551 RepID=UPI0005521987|nr:MULTISPECIES: ATPase AAA [Erwinia]
MKKLILVNGIPASGKSSVTKTLSEYFNLPVLSIDEIKEPFMVQFADVIDRPLNRKLGYAAYEAMFNIVKGSPPDAVFVMDAWFGFRDKTILTDYLTMSGCEKTLEIWNQVSPALVAERYKQRCHCRVKGHPGEEYIPELMTLAEKAQPMALGDVFTLNHDRGSNSADLIPWVEKHLN